MYGVTNTIRIISNIFRDLFFVQNRIITWSIISCILWVIPRPPIPYNYISSSFLVMPHCISFLFPSWGLHSRIKLFTRLFTVYFTPSPFFFPFPSIDTAVINLLQEALLYIIPNLYTKPVIHTFKISALLQEFYLAAQHIIFSPLRVANLRQQYSDEDGFVVRSDSCCKVNLESPPPWSCSW